MPTYRRRTRICAPLADVWEFHSRIAGLQALTPDWMNLRVEAIEGPTGERDVEVLEAGTQIRLSVRPFDIGRRQRWVSRITARESRSGSAYFVDDMVGGPFREWEHTHLFFADGQETVLVDDVRYRLPISAVTDRLTLLTSVGFETMFRQRHAKTKELLER